MIDSARNAGSTVERILWKENSPAVLPEFMTPSPVPPSMRTISSHSSTITPAYKPSPATISAILRRSRNTVIFDCCFLRHPLDRLDSIYSYYRQVDSTDPLLPRRAPLVPRNMALPGLVEMFQWSMVAAEYFLRPAFPSIRLGSGPANVSRQILSSAAEREQRLIRLWGRDLHREITRLNELDIQLTEQTGNEIRRRLSMMPSLPERVAEFGERCAAMATMAAQA